MVLRIDAALAACDASLVYLQRPQQRVALERTGQLRGPQWLTGMIDAVGQSPYGQKHRVRTLDGLAKFYDRQSALIDAVWPKLTMRRLALDVSDGRWVRHQRDINAFLGVRPAPAAVVDTTDLLGHVGQYVSTTQLPAAITTDGQSLFLQVPATHMLRLLRVGHGQYCVESLPIDIRFDYDRAGRARRFHYESRMVNEVLSDTVWTRA
jgi:hypothetical protein